MVDETLPTEMTIDGHLLKLISFLRNGETFVNGDTIVARAEELEVNLGEEDCLLLLENQGDIPVELREKIVFAFPKWRRNQVGRESMACVRWSSDDNRWYQFWCRLEAYWCGYCQGLRRKKES